MKKIYIATTRRDLAVIDRMLEDNDKYGTGEKNKTREIVVVRPDDGKYGSLSWTVVDNRGHQAFVEEFDTLDGAILYATDAYKTTEGQETWDKHGAARRKLISGLCVKDRFTRFLVDDGDREAVRKAFVESILLNEEDAHVIRFLDEVHDIGGGEHETDLLVEVTFTNSTGHTCNVDHLLESMTMLDWRMCCDMILSGLLRNAGLDSERFDWPMPVPHVTFTPEPEGTDIIQTVTIVFRTDEETWKTLREAKDAEAD